MTLQSAIKQSAKKSAKTVCFFTREDFLRRGDKSIFEVEINEDLGGWTIGDELYIKLPGGNWQEAFPLFSVDWILASDWVLVNDKCEIIV